MIYITDNGEDYSAHALYFYELPDDLPVEIGIRLCERDKRKVIGLTERVEWLDGVGTTTPIRANELLPVIEDPYISSELRDTLSLCPISVLKQAVENAIREHKDRGERIVPLWAPKKVKDGDPTWKIRATKLLELRAWIEHGAPLPPVAEEENRTGTKKKQRSTTSD